MHIQHCTPIMSLTFRHKAFREDVEHIRAIVESSNYFNKMEVDMSVELIEEYLADGPKSGYRFLFAESQQVPVAFTCYGPIEAAPGRFDLYWIAVLNEYRSLGVGREILAATEERIRHEHGVLVYAETSGKEQYHSTREFYRRNGYEQEAVIRDFYADGDDKVIFSKILSSGQSGK
ncbi:MAG: GNAT family N-acetyltransferase [Proteobacteria bacterium]|nr:GNAT family N-acetyltransferase [Pseudomonadota bacterium]